MTPVERIKDTWLAELELKSGPERPWYCSSARLRRQDANWAMGKFTWFVSEARRVGDAAEVWHEIGVQLRNWSPAQVVAN